MGIFWTYVEIRNSYVSLSLWKKHLKNTQSLISTIKTLVSIRMTLWRLTVLKPGNRRTAVSNGNGRKCFMPSEVWTAGMVGRTRAGMRPFWHVLPVGGGAKATCWIADSNRQKPEMDNRIVSITVNSLVSVIKWLQVCEIQLLLLLLITVRPELHPWEPVLHVFDRRMMMQWYLSLPNRCSHSEIVPTSSRCGRTAAGTMCLMRWFNGERGLAHTSLGKTKVNASLLLSCECATPAERFINHQLETA